MGYLLAGYAIIAWSVFMVACTVWVLFSRLGERSYGA